MHDIFHINPLVYQERTEDVVADEMDDLPSRALKRDYIVFVEGSEVVADASSARLLKAWIDLYIEWWFLWALSKRNEERYGGINNPVEIFPYHPGQLNLPPLNMGYILMYKAEGREIG